MKLWFIFSKCSKLYCFGMGCQRASYMAHSAKCENNTRRIYKPVYNSVRCSTITVLRQDVFTVVKLCKCFHFFFFLCTGGGALFVRRWKLRVTMFSSEIYSNHLLKCREGKRNFISDDANVYGRKTRGWGALTTPPSVPSSKPPYYYRKDMLE